MVDTASDGQRNPRQLYFLDTLARREALLAGMQARAGAEPDPCLAWMGVERQASRFLRETARPGASRRLKPLADDIERHRASLEETAARARAEVAGAGDATRAAAAEQLGLRIAVIGKGGAGKTMISATLARVLARRGRKVLAADLDTNPGLAYSLGLGPSASGVPGDVEEFAGATYGWRLATGVSPAEAVERSAMEAPDGVRFLSLGKIDDPEKQMPKQTVAAVRQILDGFGEPDWDVVGDMEAGPTTPFERYHSFADRVLVVVGPAWRSALTARRLLPIVGDVPTVIVANRFRDEPDHPDLEPAVRIPFDEEVARAERLGLAPLDECPDSPAVRAVTELAESFLPQEVSL
ncbi:MAG: nucleotide-binding protein [Actinomycetota bacterium]